MTRYGWHTLALGCVALSLGCPPEKKDAGGSDAMCMERAEAASSAVGRAVTSHLRCSKKSDCTQVSINTLCHAACGALVGIGGEAAVREAIAKADQGICKTFESDGCPAPLQLPCTSLPAFDCVGQGASAECRPTDGSTSDAGVDAGSEPSNECASTAVTWGQDGGLAAYRDGFSLSPCRTFTFTRVGEAVDGGDASCTNEVAVVAPLNLASVNAALADVDVVHALAAAAITYGVDARPVDGTVFRFVVGGATVDVGGACPASPGPGCKPIPKGVAALQTVLEGLANQQRALAPCMTLK